MPIHIAIPEPTSFDPAYNLRSLPQYLHALHLRRSHPHPHPAPRNPAARRQNPLHLPRQSSSPAHPPTSTRKSTANRPTPTPPPPDAARAAVDELLLQDAFNLHKPILAICQGLQALNAWLNGTLIQDIPTQIGTTVNHAPERTVLEAHPIHITPGTRLAALIPRPGQPEQNPAVPFKTPHHATVPLPLHEDPTHLYVNSSHHQAIRTPGDNLIISAISPDRQRHRSRRTSHHRPRIPLRPGRPMAPRTHLRRQRLQPQPLPRLRRIRHPLDPKKNRRIRPRLNQPPQPSVMHLALPLLLPLLLCLSSPQGICFSHCHCHCHCHCRCVCICLCRCFFVCHPRRGSASSVAFASAVSLLFVILTEDLLLPSATPGAPHLASEMWDRRPISAAKFRVSKLVFGHHDSGYVRIADHSPRTMQHSSRVAAQLRFIVELCSRKRTFSSLSERNLPVSRMGSWLLGFQNCWWNPTAWIEHGTTEPSD